jgi:hypothetical protein
MWMLKFVIRIQPLGSVESYDKRVARSRRQFTCNGWVTSGFSTPVTESVKDRCESGRAWSSCLPSCHHVLSAVRLCNVALPQRNAISLPAAEAALGSFCAVLLWTAVWGLLPQPPLSARVRELSLRRTENNAFTEISKYLLNVLRWPALWMDINAIRCWIGQLVQQRRSF